MSKMNHLLRKLHIGNDHHNRHHFTTTTTTSAATCRIPNNRTQPPPETVTPPTATTTTTNSMALTPPSSSSTSSSPPSGDRTARASPATIENVRRNPDFNLVEEDFQLQLAMAISASDPESQNDDASDHQIMAAKQLRLACSPSNPDNERLSEFLALKYWNYNVVQYDEKIVDGFYDVYAIESQSTMQGEMSLLVDLQAASVLGNVEHEVVLVNRSVDGPLQQLENKVYAISVECKVMGHGMYLNILFQRLAELVVDRMGGPVAGVEEITKRWGVRSNQLRDSLKTIVLPRSWLS